MVRPHSLLSWSLSLTLGLVKAPQEATLDSRIFLNTVSLAGDVAKHNAASSRAFDVDEFVGRLVTFMGGRSAGRGRVQDDDDEEQVRALYLPSLPPSSAHAPFFSAATSFLCLARY